MGRAWAAGMLLLIIGLTGGYALGYSYRSSKIPPPVHCPTEDSCQPVYDPERQTFVIVAVTP